MLNAFGLLCWDHVVITTALDLNGEFTGQSKRVIEGKMEEARGGVLFIDEACKLGEGSYGPEVMVKLLGMLTEPEYSSSKTIVILGGYEEDMQRMLSRNAGLASRFTERIHFSNTWSCSEQCGYEEDRQRMLSCNSGMASRLHRAHPLLQQLVQ
jgi:stage V sporulation protein K